MPSLKWTSPDAADAGEVVVFRSELPLRRRRYAVGFMRDTMRIKRLLDALAADADGGLLWYELTAHPLGNRYGTASAWRSEAHLRRFASDPVHLDVMRRQRDHLGTPTFEQTSGDARLLVAAARSGPGG
jgi:hypothetical protein